MDPIMIIVLVICGIVALFGISVIVMAIKANRKPLQNGTPISGGNPTGRTVQAPVTVLTAGGAVPVGQLPGNRRNNSSGWITLAWFLVVGFAVAGAYAWYQYRYDGMPAVMMYICAAGVLIAGLVMLFDRLAHATRNAQVGSRRNIRSAWCWWVGKLQTGGRTTALTVVLSFASVSLLACLICPSLAVYAGIGIMLIAGSISSISAIIILFSPVIAVAILIGFWPKPGQNQAGGGPAAQGQPGQNQAGGGPAA